MDCGLFRLRSGDVRRQIRVPSSDFRYREGLLASDRAVQCVTRRSEGDEEGVAGLFHLAAAVAAEGAAKRVVVRLQQRLERVPKPLPERGRALDVREEKRHRPRREVRRRRGRCRGEERGRLRLRRRGAGSRNRAAGRAGEAEPLPLDLAQQLPAGGRRRGGQLFLQQALQVAVLAQRRFGLAGSQQNANERLMRAFASGVGTDRLARSRQRTVPLAPLFQQGDELQDGLRVPIPQTVLFSQNPVFVVTGQQGTGVKVDGFPEPRHVVRRVPRLVGGAEGGLEFSYIGRVGRGVQFDRGPIRHDHGARRNPRRLQLMPQGRERLAQAVPCGVRLRAGPEQLDEHLARMRAMAVIGQVRQQQRRSLAAKARDQPLSLLNPQAAKKLYSPGLIHVALLSIAGRRVTCRIGDRRNLPLTR